MGFVRLDFNTSYLDSERNMSGFGNISSVPEPPISEYHKVVLKKKTSMNKIKDASFYQQLYF